MIIASLIIMMPFSFFFLLLLMQHFVRVVPVIGMLKEKNAFKPAPNPAEVETVFDAPLEMFIKVIFFSLHIKFSKCFPLNGIWRIMSTIWSRMKTGCQRRKSGSATSIFFTILTMKQIKKSMWYGVLLLGSWLELHQLSTNAHHLFLSRILFSRLSSPSRELDINAVMPWMSLNFNVKVSLSLH